MIECVPNLSEGRRPEVIAACRDAVSRAGAMILDVDADPDHNRSVLTFAGDPTHVRAGALALAEAAVARIDLRLHAGVHPRLGALDVLPFVPLKGATMAECVTLANDVGAEIAARHRLPVFLYGEAARAPDRRRLEHVRLNGFEGLADRLRQPAWRPDFGPSEPHPTAGATVVGARPILVAYNVNLATDQIAVARRIARSVRESSGGLAHVKALGLSLASRGLVQVSMNLTNVHVTPIRRVFDAVQALAAGEGVAIVESEIVGLVPASALSEDDAVAIALRPSDGDRILETRIARLLASGGSVQG